MTTIIGDKYEKFSTEGDWLNQLIAETCFEQKMKTVETKDAEGNVTGSEEKPDGKPTLVIENLFALAEANGIPATEKYGEQVDKKNAPGRLRMTIGNSLRAAARKRHGLYNAESDWMEAPAGFLDGREKTENPDGSKIKAEKPAPAEAE